MYGNPFRDVKGRGAEPWNTSFDSSENATLIQKMVYNPSKILIVNSRDRDLSSETPSRYKVKLGDIYKNVTSIELKGSIIPRSSYNVHSTNNKLDFSIGSSITSINMKNNGARYTFVPNVVIDKPYFSWGVQATATAVINASYGIVSSITITNPGSGYIQSKPPSVSIQTSSGTILDNNATAYAIVGTQYTATLRPGQYTIGGNPVLPDTTPSGLILEIQDAMNYVVNGSPYVSGSTGPFAVRLVSQYPTLDPIIGTPESANTNACKFNRIQIINTNNDHWELLFATGPNNKGSNNNLLGFSSFDHYSPITIAPVPLVGNTLIPGGSAFRAEFDYYLIDDPTFLLLSFWCSTNTFERQESQDMSTNRKFATIIFDANPSDTIKDTTGDIVTYDNVEYLNGLITKGAFWGPQVNLKPLKGHDYDHKKLSFVPPLGKLDYLEIQFTKYGYKNGNNPEYYDFQNRDNLLIFEIISGDQSSGQRS